MQKTKTNLFLIGSIFLCVVVASCSKTDKNALFQQKLDLIDSSIQEGSAQKALDNLSALRKKAQVPIQYLSIAKRELQLHSPVQALQSIQAGLKKYPNDSMLEAVLTHTLLQEGRAEDAAAAAETLQGTPYAGIGAEALIQADKIKQTYRTSVPFWQEGFKLTGEHIFLENAAVVLAHKGEIAQAAALRSRIAKKKPSALLIFGRVWRMIWEIFNRYWTIWSIHSHIPIWLGFPNIILKRLNMPAATFCLLRMQVQDSAIWSRRAAFGKCISTVTRILQAKYFIT